MATPTPTKTFIDAECMHDSCRAHHLGFLNKEAAKDHVEQTQHSVIIREHVATIWRA